MVADKGHSVWHAEASLSNLKVEEHWRHKERAHFYLSKRPGGPSPLDAEKSNLAVDQRVWLTLVWRLGLAASCG